MTFGLVHAWLERWLPDSPPQQLTDPSNTVLAKHIREDTSSVSITATKDGRYEYCFSNQMSAIADKMVRYAGYTSYT